jgi:hypothetical protein
MNEIIDLKQEFYISVESQLESLGFIKTNDTYESIINHQLPGQQISINGQTMQYPGKTIELKNTIKLYSDGCISDNDGSNEIGFTQICFTMNQDGEKIREHCECFYWNEFPYFINIFNQIFNI